MLCQACGKHPATTHVKTIRNGMLSEYSLCAECAAKMGYSSLWDGFGLDFMGNLLGGFLEKEEKTQEETVRCPVCGCSFADIAHSGKVGCARCYTVFEDQLAPSIQRIHGNTSHRGKHPGGSTLAVKPDTQIQAKPSKEDIRDRLQKELQAAIDSQNFEYAAVLRDRIKELEGQE